MSIWTHICGCIRYDGIEFLGQKVPDLGKTCSFDDDEDVWEACTVPSGSEGSLQYYLKTNDDDSQLSRWTAMFYGDLRDYEDTAEVVSYFNSITEGQFVRAGVFAVEVEGHPTKVYLYDQETKAWAEK